MNQIQGASFTLRGGMCAAYIRLWEAVFRAALGTDHSLFAFQVVKLYSDSGRNFVTTLSLDLVTLTSHSISVGLYIGVCRQHDRFRAFGVGGCAAPSIVAQRSRHRRTNAQGSQASILGPAGTGWLICILESTFREARISIGRQRFGRAVGGAANAEYLRNVEEKAKAEAKRRVTAMRSGEQKLDGTMDNQKDKRAVWHWGNVETHHAEKMQETRGRL
ncbi:hypothetical protein B0H13DRAFT_1879298 [Mycena leptocephala]|nr:hypothetical protein B0H13DRAFT_1879298 [Mycena leptocephala]